MGDPSNFIDIQGLAPVRVVNGISIYGTGQVTGAGHAELSEKMADVFANSGRVKEVHLNRSYESITGVVTTPRRSPDVTVIGNNGKVYAIEIASDLDMKGNNLQKLTDRNKVALNQLSEHMRGDIVVIEKTYLDSDVKEKIDKVVKGCSS